MKVRRHRVNTLLVQTLDINVRTISVMSQTKMAANHKVLLGKTHDSSPGYEQIVISPKC